MTTTTPAQLRLALPKGRMKEGVLDLLRSAGIQVHLGSRNYRPSISLDHVETKMLKPQNIVEMLHVGTRDIGFAGADWVAELGVEVVELLDLGLDPVRVVAAAPKGLVTDGKGLAEGRLSFVELLELEECIAEIAEMDALCAPVADFSGDGEGLGVVLDG